MKKIIHNKIVLAFWISVALFFSVLARGQNNQAIDQGFVYPAEIADHEPCISPAQYADMDSHTQSNISKLKSEGRLLKAGNKIATVTQTFNWPLTYRSNFYDNDYFFIQNYIDHDASPGSTQEYQCGTRTYDTPTYNHAGTDICIGPYWWSMMDAAYINVIAAAPGQIVDKADGNYDRNCGFGAGNANFVKIMHSDGSFAIYFHMKTGSVTSKAIGENVALGEYLGLVGSSGSSTNPHLHFEVRDQSNAVIDPWVGPCNPDISSSLWNNQLPYNNAGIMRLMSMSGAATTPTCPGAETVPVVNHFVAGSTIRFEAHLRDLIPGNVLTMTVYDPAGVSLYNSNTTLGGNFSAAGYYYVTLPLAGNAPTGTYKFYTSYGGKTAAHYFTVGCPGAYSLSGAHSGLKGYLSGSTITSVSTIAGSSSNNIWYEAENYIQANPGFRATAGCHFRARIDNCSAGGSSPVQRIKTDNEASISISATPSLVTNNTMLHFNLLQDGPVTLSVYDLTGRKIKSLINNQATMQGEHEFELSAEELSAGFYLVTIESGDSKASCKIVVQK